MSDLITIDDAGTLTTTTGASDDVFYLVSPNGTVWQVTVDAVSEAMTWEFDIPLGTPEGRVEVSATKWWKFSMANDGSLSWTEITNPDLDAEFAVSVEGCAGAALGVSVEGCAGAAVAVSGEGCSGAASAIGGSC